MSSSDTQAGGASLKERWEMLRQDNPRLRIRDAAENLGVSEAELLVSDCGNTVTRLEGDPGDMLLEFKTMGRVMALTRNDYAVHERVGVYDPVQIQKHASIVVGEDIDLRMFFGQWVHKFAVEQAGDKGDIKRSIQFFDKTGLAIHKTHLKPDSSVEAFTRIVEKFKSDDQTPEFTAEAPKPPKGELPDSEIDQEGFIQAWRDLKDTHDFYMLLGKFRVSRTQALRIAPDDLAVQVDNMSHRKILDSASETKLPIMVFIGNSGCIQIHTGNVEKVMEFKDWYNVMDPDFNLHLCESGIHSSYLVHKPTEDGVVTSLEQYDKDGELLITFFGKRKPGNPELPEWRELADSLA